MKVFQHTRNGNPVARENSSEWFKPPTSPTGRAQRYVLPQPTEGLMKNIILPLVVLIAFAAYTVFSMSQAEQSLIQFGLQLMSSLDTAQVVIDLYILAALACVWMYHDNKSRGKSFAAVIPYLLITAIFVSIGPLLYLVVKGFAKHSRAAKT